jgi:hypothetical protein
MFTEEEMAQITIGAHPDFAKFAPDWKLLDCGPDMDPGLRAKYRGREQVFLTHPLDRDTPCRIVRSLEVPQGKRTVLVLTVTHDERGDWTLAVKVDGKQIEQQKVGPEAATDGWLDLSLDLSEYAGRTVDVELLNIADDWSWEAGYWAKIEVRSEDP